VDEAIKIFRALANLDNGSGRIIRSEFFLYTIRDQEIVKAIKRLGYRYPKVIGWGRASIEDVKRAIDAGLDEMVMLMSISDIHIRYKLGLTRDRAVAKYLEAAEYAMKNGISLRCSLEDITRSDIPGLVVPFVRRLLRLSERYGVELVVKLPTQQGLVSHIHTSHYHIPCPRSYGFLEGLLDLDLSRSSSTDMETTI